MSFLKMGNLILKLSAQMKSTEFSENRDVGLGVGAAHGADFAVLGFHTSSFHGLCTPFVLI